MKKKIVWGVIGIIVVGLVFGVYLVIRSELTFRRNVNYQVILLKSFLVQTFPEEVKVFDENLQKKIQAVQEQKVAPLPINEVN